MENRTFKIFFLPILKSLKIFRGRHFFWQHRIRKNRIYPNIFNFHSHQGVSLPELILAVLILSIALTAIIKSYIRCVDLAEISKNQTIANFAVNSRFEQIKNTDYALIKSTYNNVTFTTTGLTGTGVSYINDSDPNLLLVTISFCWRQSNRRIVGEDTNLNGVLNSGEDKNGNGLIDSRVQLVSYIYGS